MSGDANANLGRRITLTNKRGCPSELYWTEHTCFSVYHPNTKSDTLFQIPPLAPWAAFAGGAPPLAASFLKATPHSFPAPPAAAAAAPDALPCCCLNADRDGASVMGRPIEALGLTADKRDGVSASGEPGKPANSLPDGLSCV